MNKEDKQSWRNQFCVGDRVRVQLKKSFFEGTVITKKGRGISKTFTVRRIGANKVAIERIFPLYSPNISKVDIIGKAKKRVRRAKLYYLRRL